MKPLTSFLLMLSITVALAVVLWLMVTLGPGGQ